MGEESGTEVPPADSNPTLGEGTASRSSGGRSSDWKLALLSAGAALLGSLIGGGISYALALSGQEFQGESDLLARREADYATYLSSQPKLQGIENTLRNYIQENDPDISAINEWSGKYYEAVDAAVSADYVVALSCSPEVDELRTAIVDAQTDIDTAIHSLANDSRYGRPYNRETLDDLSNSLDRLPGLHGDFAGAARYYDLRIPD
ncbi:hypothetical protein [Mycolicibacterium grossiae]|uniref:hypothetical protein n=1 Tax=Mycolicibacterium grossiae TaxID=1552759 RepID=UPI000F795C92|nr:hypothetical protein [Mycolicibacterium grossiae]QEM43565.1 hypothetical protein FZ046_01140 [Mycolicibacterium grossiae]